jgi:hypothetical protein
MKSIIPPRLEALIRSRLGVSTPPSPSTAGGCDLSDIRGATSRSRRRRENDPSSSCVMSDAEIKRALLRYRYDRIFRGDCRVPIKTLAGYIGLSHETLYQAMKGSISERTRVIVSWAIAAIAEGRLRFRRCGQAWQIEYRHPSTRL